MRALRSRDPRSTNPRPPVDPGLLAVRRDVEVRGPLGAGLLGAGELGPRVVVGVVVVVPGGQHGDQPLLLRVSNYSVLQTC